MTTDMNDGNTSDDASHAAHVNEVNIQKDRMGTPPPPYSLTNACLPPLDTQQKRWPPEPPPPFEGFPAYPAGPKLQKTEYPRNVPGPTYACPHCEGTFLYHRPNGLVECPFCYATISIGHYVRLRALSQVLLGLFLLLGSISFFTIIAMGMSSSQNYFFIAAAFIALWALILLMRAARLRSNCKEAERIEF